MHALLAKLAPIAQAATEAASAASNNACGPVIATGQPLGEPLARAPQPPPEVVFCIGQIPVQNTVVTGWLVIVLLAGFAFLSTRGLKESPGGLQNFWELIVELWTGLVEQSMGHYGRNFLPLIGTAFLFILFSNWMGTLPFVGNVTIVNPLGETVPLFRSANSDLNLTASMAVLVILLAEFMELRSLGPLGYLKGLLLPNPLRWLEIFTRPLSLAFRLFGNIFAGEVLVFTMLGVAPVVLFVFLGLELFVGLIQSLIFSMLSLVYLTIATAHLREHLAHAHEGDHGSGEAHGAAH